MSIERAGRGGPIGFTCDAPSCHEVFQSMSRDFGTALAEAKEDGWRARKDGDDWVHLCRECVN
jgi:hypothetical protein